VVRRQPWPRRCVGDYDAIEVAADSVTRRYVRWTLKQKRCSYSVPIRGGSRRHSPASSRRAICWRLTEAERVRPTSETRGCVSSGEQSSAVFGDTSRKANQFCHGRIGEQLFRPGPLDFVPGILPEVESSGPPLDLWRFRHTLFFAARRVGGELCRRSWMECPMLTAMRHSGADSLVLAREGLSRHRAHTSA